MRVWTALQLAVLAAWVSVAAAERDHGSWSHSGASHRSDAPASEKPGASSVPLTTLLSQLAGSGSSHASAVRRPAWLESTPMLGALTSSVDTDVANGDALVDGIVVRIAPRFVVTTATLLSGRGLARLRNASVATRAVVFNGAVSQVTRVSFESDYFGADSYPLVVLELGEEPTGVPLAKVVTSTPNKDFEFEQLSLLNVGGLLDSKAVLADGVVSRVANDGPTKLSKLTFFVEPMCGFKPPVVENPNITELCVGQLTRTTGTSFFDSGSWQRDRHLATSENRTDSRLESNLTMAYGLLPSSNLSRRPDIGSNGTQDAVVTPFPSTQVSVTGMQGATFSAAAVLLYGGDVVGLSIPSLTVPKRFMTSFDGKLGFLRLAAPDHRAFLEAATNKSVQYEDDDVFSKLSKYPSYLATFLDSSGKRLTCQGVLIAPKVVLTTASCLSSEPDISAVQFFASDPAQRETVPVVRNRMASHPRYANGSVAYDTAVVGLERAVTFAPIQLDDGSADGSTTFARIQVADDDECVISATVTSHDSDVCHGASGNKLRSGFAFCVVPVAASDTAASSFSAKNFVGDDAVAKVESQPLATRGAALVTVTRLSSVALVGLAVKPGVPSASSQRRGLQTTSQGEVYVRVANSATFINAYVTGTSWTVSMKMSVESVGASEGDDDTELPASEQFVVGLRTTKDGQNYCGGSLIGPTSVLTAAHCVVDGPAHFVSIGAYNSSGVQAEVIAVLADKTQIHSQYGKPHQFSFDVAILELAYASAVEPVVLDDTADFTARESATMYGYGMSSATSGLSPTLRAVSMPLWSRAACRQAFGAAVDDSMLCAGGVKGKDACTGDSGSPLVLARGGKNVLVGVVSAGSGCGLENVPGVYARIHSVRDFVSSHAIGVDWDSAGGQGTDDSDKDSDGGASSTGSKAGSAAQNPSEIEAREAGNNGTNSTGKGTTTSSPATGPYSIATLTLEDLTPPVRASLMDFLLGADAERVMDEATIAAMKASDNVLQFYSTGELATLLAIVARHNALPLNQRRDRFGRWKGSSGGSTSSSTKACTV